MQLPEARRAARDVEVDTTHEGVEERVDVDRVTNEEVTRHPDAHQRDAATPTDFHRAIGEVPTGELEDALLPHDDDAPTSPQSGNAQ